ncbi:sugar phosphate isomerase/epimerase [Streptomyces sp. 5-10]|uniref:sugar phosphate isomerase/epimerase family protein n=1 Tax=Streptomyces sp. 5-10 TaxID=878925 RepID=UPI00168B176E|nr:sugar phosphate isomerase/epimerase family protein [Streptomyces sp. 5-10]MBD3005478.1 sugar phosphate isomerase/epimerase [Streptomyces sp. 5-10]
MLTLDNPRLLPISDFPRRARDEFGVDLVETVGFHFTGLDDPEIPRFEKALADADVGLVDMALDMGDLLDPDEERRAGDIAVLKEWIARFAAMGSSFVRVNPGSPLSPWEAGEPPAHLAAALVELGEFARAEGTRLLVENHGGPSGNPGWLHALLDEVGSEHCGLLLDLGNLEPLLSALMKVASDPPESGTLDLAASLSALDLSPLYAGLESLAPRAELVSVKTNWVAADGTVGAVDLDRAMAILVSHGYDGVLSIEYEGFGGDPWAKTRRVVDVAREAYIAAQAQ